MCSFLIGTQIYVLNGTDPEEDPVRYGLAFEKGSTEYFRVDPKSGNVTLIQELDREVSILIKTPGLETHKKTPTLAQSDVTSLFFIETR